MNHTHVSVYRYFQYFDFSIVTQDRLGGLDLADEWQEDDIPGMPPAENVSDDSSDSEGSRSRHSSNSSHSSMENRRGLSYPRLFWHDPSIIR